MMNRRDFIKKSLIGVAALACAPVLPKTIVEGIEVTKQVPLEVTTVKASLNGELGMWQGFRWVPDPPWKAAEFRPLPNQPVDMITIVRHPSDVDLS